MKTELLAGGFRTLIVSMLSERVMVNSGDVFWMGIGKLIHIHRWQDCLLNPLKTGSGRESLMLFAYIRPYIDSCCWSVHGWHDHRQFLRQWDSLTMWMRGRRDGSWIHADVAGTEGSDAGAVEGMHWPQFRAKARPFKLIFKWIFYFC